MEVTSAAGRARYNLQLFYILSLSCLLLSCGSSRLAPQLAEDQATALVVDSLITPDPAAEAFIQPYKAKLNASLDSIVGYAAREMEKKMVESGIGNFVADLTQEAAQEQSQLPVDLGVVTIGGLRVPLAAGPIRLRDIYELMPFENRILILRLTGEQTRALFEFAAEQKIVAISNSRMQVRDGKPVEILINGKPFDPSRSYTVATSDYLAGGGDNMALFRDAERVSNTNLLLRTAIINKIAQLNEEGKKVDAREEGRIVELD